MRNITTDANNALLVTSIISIAHNLHFTVIAEGVETPGQLDFLQSGGCDEIQGDYFSIPLAGRDFEQFLQQKKNA